MLEKFKEIEVENEKRLCDEDVEHLKKLNNFYLKNKATIFSMIEASNKLYEAQQESNEEVSPYKCSIVTHYNISDIFRRIKKEHNAHISNIYQYFIDKYSVKLSNYDYNSLNIN